LERLKNPSIIGVRFLFGYIGTIIPFHSLGKKVYHEMNHLGTRRLGESGERRAAFIDKRSILMRRSINAGDDVMNLSRDIKSVSYLKSKTSDLLKQINETRQPVIITQNGEPRAVLQDPESYENMRNAIGLLKLVSQGEKDIKKGKFKSQEEVFANIENIINKKVK